MSEGERVVFTFVDKGPVMEGDQKLFKEGHVYPCTHCDFGHPAKDRLSPGDRVIRRIPDPVPALEARIAELEAYRNAANYWYMVCKQDRGQTVTRWSSNDADDRAIKEAATERQVSRQRLNLLGSLLDQWDQLSGDVKSYLSTDAPAFVQAIRAIQKIDAIGGDK